MLLNLDVKNGLGVVYGTSLQVETLGRFTIGCKFICGDKIGQPVVIPRIDKYWDKKTHSDFDAVSFQ